MNPPFAEQYSLRGIIGATLGLVLALAGSGGCASHQPSQSIAPTHRSDPSGSISSPYADSTIGKPHITVVDLSKKFLAFFDSASRTPLDRDALWAMWQRLYGFAARPPGPFGDTLARRLFEGAWERYPAALPRIRQGAEGFGFVPNSVLRQVADLLGCGADTHVRLIAFVGGFGGNAFAFPGPDGTQTIAIPLEAGDARGALVHELTHAVHRSKTCANITSGYEMSLPELVLSEGVAMRATERLIPGYPSIHYIRGSQAWFDSADSRRTAILDGIHQHISDVGGATARPLGEQQCSARHEEQNGHQDEDKPRPSLVEPEGDVAADVKWQEYDREQGCDGQCVGLHWSPGRGRVASYGCPIRRSFCRVSALRSTPTRLLLAFGGSPRGESECYCGAPASGSCAAVSIQTAE
jgi:hypothetical protein